MKFLQINVWQGRLMRPLLELIQAETPDVICTQEIYTFTGPIDPTSPWNYFRTLEWVAKAGRYEHIYFSPCTSYTMFGGTLSFGNAILSKFPLSETSTHYTGGPGPIHHDNPAEHDGGNPTRNFQHAVLDTGPTKIHLINQHGYWVDQPLGDKISVERTMQLAKFAAGLKGPVIVAGDFNLSSDSPAMQQLLSSTNLTDNVAAAGIKTTLSAAHYVTTDIACDYILTSPAVTVENLRASDRLVSDHKAIFANISA